MRHTLKKHEIVRSRKEIEQIFKTGSSFFQFPFRVFYIMSRDMPGTCRILFAVSSKQIQQASDRNLIRRRMREAYRLNKHRLLKPLDQKASISLALVFVGKDKIPYVELENKLNKVLLRLIHVVEV